MSGFFDFLGLLLPWRRYAAAVAPINLTATAVGDTRVQLNWTDRSTDESGYIVERSLTSGSGFVEVARLDPNTTAYLDGGLRPATTYYYRVRAYGTSPTSASNEASATTGGLARPDGRHSQRLTVFAHRYYVSHTFFGTFLADWTADTLVCQFSSNEHGYASCRLEIEMDYELALNWLELVTWNVTIYGDDGEVWIGRVEDAAVNQDGLAVTALGYWRAWFDFPVSGLFSDDSPAGWVAVTPEHAVPANGTFKPQLFSMDSNNRIFIGLVKDTVYPINGRGALRYHIPDRSVLDRISRVEFDYEFQASADWEARMVTNPDLDADVGDQTVAWSLAGDGTLQSGSATVTTSAEGTVDFRLYATTGTTYTGETGDDYLKITNLRIMGDYPGAVYADDVVWSLLNAIRDGSSSGVQLVMHRRHRIESPAEDLLLAIAEDDLPADFALRFKPIDWELAVWEKQTVYFRPYGLDTATIDEFDMSNGRGWLIEIGDFEVERSAESVVNSAYAVYRGQDGITRRTTNEHHLNQEEGHLFYMHQEAIRAETTSESTAEALRDAVVAARAYGQLRLRVVVSTVHAAGGEAADGWQVRANDYATIINLPPALDDVFTFRIGQADYDAINDQLTIEPAEPAVTLAAMLARSNG